MKKILIAGAAVLALTAAQPTIAQAQVNWHGHYFGGNAGYAWGTSDTDSPLTNIGGGQQYIPSVVADINAQRFQTLNPSGFTGGVQWGFNVQLPPGNPFVFGAELDFNSLHLSQTRSVSAFFTAFPGPGPAPTYTNSISTNWLFTARGRLGFAPTGSNWLIYATGGLAVTNLTYKHTFAEGVFPGTSTGVEASTVSTNKAGYVIGGGWEYAWPGTHWSFKAEYLHIGFGNVTSSAPVVFPGGPGTSIFSHKADLTVDIVRIGLNYAFILH